MTDERCFNCNCLLETTRYRSYDNNGDYMLFCRLLCAETFIKTTPQHFYKKEVL